MLGVMVVGLVVASDNYNAAKMAMFAVHATMIRRLRTSYPLVWGVIWLLPLVQVSRRTASDGLH